MIDFEVAISKILWDIIGISEIRRGFEAIIERRTGIILCHSVAENGNYGVGFVIKNKWKNKIKAFIPINARIAVLIMELHTKLTLTIVQVHAPTATATDDIIEDFYSKLEATIIQYGENNPNLLVIGDFNARIGGKESGEHVMGCSNFGLRNDRGRRLLNFAQSFQLKIVNSFFEQKTNKKWTWISPCGNKHQLDYILARNIKQISKLNTLNINYNTDHRMLRIDLMIDKDEIRKSQHKKKTIFKPTVENTHIYKIKLEEKLKELNTQLHSFTEVQKLYDTLECILTLKLASDTRMEKRSCKLNEKTLEVIERREKLKKIRNKSVAQKIDFSETCKLSKKLIRQDIYESNLKCIELHVNKTGALRKMKKDLLTGTSWTPSIKNANDILVYDRDTILEHATKYYENIYKSTMQSGIKSTQQNTAQEVPEFMESEVSKSIKNLKKDKCPGSDGITNELIIMIEDTVLKPLTHLFNMILSGEVIPKQWRESNIILLHKKGAKDKIENYRPISLISTLYKIFITTLMRRINNTLDDNQPPEQAGFRKAFSTVDHIHAINQIIEKAREYNITLYIMFIDFEKAFDSIEHQCIIESLENIGVEQKYVNILNNIYTNSTARIILASIYYFTNGLRLR